VTYFGGIPGCVTKCDRGYVWSKLAKNSVTYFLDGPLDTWKEDSLRADVISLVFVRNSPPKKNNDSEMSEIYIGVR